MKNHSGVAGGDRLTPHKPNKVGSGAMRQPEQDTYAETIRDRELTVSQSTHRAVLLFHSALLLNLLIPLVLFGIWAVTFPFPEILVGFMGLLLGLEISHYASIWLWVRSYASVASKRVVVGTLLSCAMTFTVFLWLSIYFFGLRGSFDALNTILGMLLGVAFYWAQGISISLMIYPMNLSLGKSSGSSNSGRQYSIRFLLVSMIAAAILSLVGKNVFQAIDKSDWISNPSFQSLGEFFFWIVWAIPWTALVTSLYLGSYFSRFYRYYSIGRWTTIILGPSLCALSGAHAYSYLTSYDSTLSIREILFFYAVTIGYLLGLSLAIDLLPSQRSLNQQETL